MSTKREFKKASTPILKLKVGDEIEGKLIGRTTAPTVDKKTGEESELTRLFFEKDNGEKFIIFEDGGLRNGLANAMVKEGDYLKIIKLEKSDIGQGRTVNNYDIYVASN